MADLHPHNDLTGWEFRAAGHERVRYTIGWGTQSPRPIVHTVEHTEQRRMVARDGITSGVARMIFEAERSSRLHDGVMRIYFCEVCCVRRTMPH